MVSGFPARCFTTRRHAFQADTRGQNLASDIMSDNVVNLRMARKHKARAAAERQAEQNRVRFGQTKAEKQVRKAEEQRAARQHEAGRLDGRDNVPERET